MVNGVKQKDGTTKSKVITIEKSSTNGTTPVNNEVVSTNKAKADAENGTGTNALVGFNIKSKGDGIINADGTTGRPSEIGLAHELIHAESMKLGNNKTSQKLPNVIDPDTRSKGKMTKEELISRIRENLIRKEHGYKDRKIPE